MRLVCSVLCGFVLAFAGTPLARAGKLVPAFDPTLHVKPPLQTGLDGQTGPLVIDADFAAAAARFRRENPGYLRAGGQAVVDGEVLIVEGDDELVDVDDTGRLGVRSMPALARRVIETVGDHFHAITVWLTFNDRMSETAAAYELTVRNEVQGLGRDIPVRDMSQQFGSGGVLRSMLNMKTVGLRAGDTEATWQRHFEVWGQESAHRWLMFMWVRDPRTGQITDALLGRDCAHYSRFVQTQASVHDGLSWTDNGNGTFTWTETSKRYGDLDLYGMGLLAADEVPPFFFIDDIPGYTYPRCGRAYDSTSRPLARTISGRRVDVTIDDIIAANGERIPSADEVRQDYWREALVILTQPTETAESPNPRLLAARLNKARLWWETWNRTASRNRLVMCTQITGDCGDPRSDVAGLSFNTDNKSPRAGLVPFTLDVENKGGRTATGVRAVLGLQIGERKIEEQKEVGALEPGASRKVVFDVDLRDVACGTEIKAKAHTQSDFHYSRLKKTFVLGTVTQHIETFEAESGWTTDPDGDDSSTGAVWERGGPEETTLLQRQVQPGAARAGAQAFVTGVAAVASPDRATFVRAGKTTLQSPAYDASQMREPSLRYWVSFAGVRAGYAGALEPSPESRLRVFARSVDAQGGGPQPWLLVDELANEITAGWTQRSIALPAGLDLTAKIQLRFVVEDRNPEQGGVEAAIDDVELLSNLPACYVAALPPMDEDKGGCDCTLGGPARGPGALAGIIVLWVVLGTARRRRR